MGSPAISQGMSLFEMQNFPEEVLLNIFGNLPPAALASARGVCQQWKRLAEGDALWQPISRELGLTKKNESQSCYAYTWHEVTQTLRELFENGKILERQPVIEVFNDPEKYDQTLQRLQSKGQILSTLKEPIHKNGIALRKQPYCVSNISLKFDHDESHTEYVLGDLDIWAHMHHFGLRGNIITIFSIHQKSKALQVTNIYVKEMESQPDSGYLSLHFCFYAKAGREVHLKPEPNKKWMAHHSFLNADVAKQQYLPTCGWLGEQFYMCFPDKTLIQWDYS